MSGSVRIRKRSAGLSLHVIDGSKGHPVRRFLFRWVVLGGDEVPPCADFRGTLCGFWQPRSLSLVHSWHGQFLFYGESGAGLGVDVMLIF